MNFDEMFDQHRDELRRLIDLRLDRRLRQRVDVSDILQETYLEALQRLPDFLDRRPMPFEVWLKQTARQKIVRCYRDHAGTEKRSVNREQALPDHSSMLIAQSLLADQTSPSEAASQREFRALVYQAISELNETDRELLLMRNIEDLPYREIAATLEIDEAAARQRYGRALKRLRTALGE